MNVPNSVKRLFPNVKKVVDARTPVDVSVTAKDNSGGKVGDAANCAMARAACREFKADHAVIGIGTSYVIKGNTAIRYKTPPLVAREITSFDRNHDFRPGQYALAAPAPSSRLGVNKNRARDKRRGKPSGPNSGKTVKNRRIIQGTQGVRVLAKG